MAQKYDYDYFIIGSGAAGSAAALALARAKPRKSVAVAEGGTWGGSLFNTLGIPYSASLNFSHAYHHLLSYPAVHRQDFHFNFPTLASSQDHLITSLSATHRARLEGAGIACLSGYAHLLDPHTVAVGATRHTAGTFILATGSQLHVANITGLDTVNYLTPTTAIKARRLPEYAIIIGGGPTGCELATYYAELGARVIIVERAARLLPHLDPAISTALTEYFTTHLSIHVLTSAKVVAIEQERLAKRIIFKSSREEKMVRVDCIILATGRAPLLDYGLENAGVTYQPSGITVGKLFQTSTPNIYAIGSSIASPSSTLSHHQGLALATNLLRHTKLTPNPDHFISTIRTTPSVATVGTSYNTAPVRRRTATVQFQALPTLPEPLPGFLKLSVDDTGRLCNAAVVAPSAELIISELALALRSRLTLTQLSQLRHPLTSPTAAIDLAVQQLL